jgi:hypothetical protein
VRIKNLGILLPFKIKVIAVWKAHDHTALERELHDKFRYCRINGEWFQFHHDEIKILLEFIPESVLVFFDEQFSNIDEDTRKGKKIIGVRTQKLRGNFTLEEREVKRQAAIQAQKEKKLLKKI